jgi:hypothetical protein
MLKEVTDKNLSRKNQGETTLKRKETKRRKGTEQRNRRTKKGRKNIKERF